MGDELSVNWTGNGAAPLLGDPEKNAIVGGETSVISCVVILDPAQFAAVNLTVCNPTVLFVHCVVESDELDPSPKSQ